MLTQDDCFRLGHIARLHGFKGELTIFLDTEDPIEFKGLESVFVEYDKKLVPFFLERIQLRDRGHATVKFEDIDTEKQAKNLVGCSLYLPLDNLPETAEGEYYYHEIIGFKVLDRNRGEIGVVTKVLDLSGNPLIEINFDGKEILLPKQDQFIEKVDKENRVLYVNAPEGLIGMYLGEEE
jgi:16S rRNA processing protein RimM